MLHEQENLADETKSFLIRWGLKSRYVAEVCDIPERTLSRFVNHKLALSDMQLARLEYYIADYELRNR